jgi:hypothetical protein
MKHKEMALLRAFCSNLVILSHPETEEEVSDRMFHSDAKQGRRLQHIHYCRLALALDSHTWELC